MYKRQASSRPLAPPSDSPKCLRFAHWLTLCTLKIHLHTYLLTYTRISAINKFFCITIYNALSMLNAWPIEIKELLKFCSGNLQYILLALMGLMQNRFIVKSRDDSNDEWFGFSIGHRLHHATNVRNTEIQTRLFLTPSTYAPGA